MAMPNPKNAVVKRGSASLPGSNQTNSTRWVVGVLNWSRRVYNQKEIEMSRKQEICLGFGG